MVDIVILSNVAWHISPRTKESLLRYAGSNRVILEVGNDYNGDSEAQTQDCDIIKYNTVKNKCVSDTVYILDDDDWLMSEIQPVPDGFDGSIYPVQYGEEVLEDVDKRRMGIGLGYARCVFKRDWYLKSAKTAIDIGLVSCIDVFVLYDLFLNGRVDFKNEILCGIDKTPRTMFMSKYRKEYKEYMKIIKDFFWEL